MKRLLLLCVMAALLIPATVRAGAPCPSSTLLYCGRHWDQQNPDTCSHLITSGATEACESERELALNECYNNCASTSGCSAV